MPTQVRRTLNFCDHDPTSESLGAEKTTRATQDISHPATSGPYYPAYRSDPLAADKPGEELLPEASVWQIYKKEANDYDNELVKRHNDNLDTMLIFAALFSAVLAAFLVESMRLLHEDPAEKSAALLLILVKSQLGATNISSANLDDLPFVPRPCARWLNGLWLVALGFSLAAASLAMLSKEWLDSYTASHKRAPHAFAVTRQARLDAFEAWHASRIMDLVPTILHLSLFLFALGLVIYLWHLDRIIAMILSAVMGLTSSMYLGTTICGSYFELCPFLTHLTRYFHLKNQPRDGDLDEKKPPLSEDNCTTAAEVRSLAWLAKNARDEESSKSAYEALAGLHKRPMRSPPPYESKQEYTSWLQEQHDASLFLRDCVARFRSTLVGSPRQLAKCKGENVIRYARALPEIAIYMNNFTNPRHALPSTQRGSRDQGKLTDTANKTLALTFGTLDMLWTGKFALTASTYAYVIATELRLIRLAATKNIHHSHDSQSALNQTVTDSSRVRIDMGSTSQRFIAFNSAEFLSRYGASLSCAISLVCGHVNSVWGGLLDNRVLYDLLEAMETTTMFILRLPPAYLQFLHNKDILHSVGCQTGGASFQSISGDGLTTLLKLTSTPDLNLPPEVICASARTLYAIGLLHKHGLKESNCSTLTSGELQALEARSNFTGDHDSPIIWVMRVVRLAISDYHASSLIEASLCSLLRMIESTYSMLPREEQIEVRCDLALLIPLAEQSMNYWSQDAKCYLINILAYNAPNSPPEACQSIWGNLFHLQDLGHKMIIPEHIQNLLTIIQQMSGHISEVALLLEDLVKLFDRFGGATNLTGIENVAAALNNPYLQYFTAGLGFDQLAEIGKNADYAPSVARTTINICTSSHLQEKKPTGLGERLLVRFGIVDEQDVLQMQEGMDIFKEYQASPLIPHTQTISNVAMPGFLDAVSIALDHIQTIEADASGQSSNTYFIDCAMKLLNVSLVTSHGDFDEACGLKASEIVRRLCQLEALELESEAAKAIAQYGQYSELPTQTNEEIEMLQDGSMHSGTDETPSADPHAFIPTESGVIRGRMSPLE